MCVKFEQQFVCKLKFLAHIIIWQYWYISSSVANKNYILPYGKEIHYFPYVLVWPELVARHQLLLLLLLLLLPGRPLVTDRIYYFNARYMMLRISYTICRKAKWNILPPLLPMICLNIWKRQQECWLNLLIDTLHEYPAIIREVPKVQWGWEIYSRYYKRDWINFESFAVRQNMLYKAAYIMHYDAHSRALPHVYCSH